MQVIQQAIDSMKNEPILPAPQYKRIFNKLNEDMMDAYRYAFLNKQPEPKNIWMPEMIRIGNMLFDGQGGRIVGYDENGKQQMIIGKIDEGEKMSAKPMSPVIEKLVELAESNGKMTERVRHQGEHLQQDQDVIQELQYKVNELTRQLSVEQREAREYRDAYREVRAQLEKIQLKEQRAKARKAAAAKKAKKTVKKSK